jgi:RNase H-fold protein (predicted Holliday junction resolvase)
VTEAVLAVDPGSAKCGYAMVDAAGTVLVAGIAASAELYETLARLLSTQPAGQLAIGAGAQGRAMAGRLQGLGLPIHLVDEHETTRRARELYFREHPPRGWRRLLPLGMQLPPRPVDDYAAILIARRFLARNEAPSPAK